MRNIDTKVDNTAPSGTGRLPAAQFNSIQDEMENAAVSSGITLDPSAGPDTDLYMLSQAMARYASGGIFCRDTGSVANSFVLSSPKNFRMPKAYFTGMTVLFYPAHASTGASQINAFTLGGKSLLDHDGVALVGGEVVADQLCCAIYDETLLTGAGAFKLAPWANALVLGAAGGGTLTDLSWKNLLVFPEITSANNVFTFTTGTGQVVVASGITWLWRGWQSFTSADILSGNRTFATSALKTYHLRWHAPGTGNATPSGTYPNGRFVLKDLADSGYNPSTLSETNTAFDSTYDDMLIARVVTDSGNSPTVTALKNMASLKAAITVAAATDSTNGNGIFGSGNYTIVSPRLPSSTISGLMLLVPPSTSTLNWARTPDVTWNAGSYQVNSSPMENPIIFTDDGVSKTDNTGTETVVATRYGQKPIAWVDMNTVSPANYGFQFRGVARA